METDVAETPGKRALPPQDSPFSQENCTEEGEVAALRLTARSQGETAYTNQVKGTDMYNYKRLPVSKPENHSLENGKEPLLLERKAPKSSCSDSETSPRSKDSTSVQDFSKEESCQVAVIDRLTRDSVCDSSTETTLDCEDWLENQQGSQERHWRGMFTHMNSLPEERAPEHDVYWKTLGQKAPGKKKTWSKQLQGTRNISSDLMLCTFFYRRSVYWSLSYPRALEKVEKAKSHADLDISYMELELLRDETRRMADIGQNTKELSPHHLIPGLTT
ncbi:hypothetical protein E5288_WYG000763 [Bos mutus]|uniref:Uncharacterized protein n=1 Tax=Bos mutus TaxID=72004 RepID=A0A6B0RPW4_9CETA|nr:hypothetical protein [Bos mutus]